jgi:WXG100 family type VII secretion target
MEQWNTSVGKIFSLQQELDAMWEGEAHDEFVRVFTEDKPKFSRLYEIMQEYQNSIITSANAYIEADRQAKNKAGER